MKNNHSSIFIVMIGEINWNETELYLNNVNRDDPLDLVCVWYVDDVFHCIGTFLTADSKQYSHWPRATEEITEKHIAAVIKPAPIPISCYFEGVLTTIYPPMSFQLDDSKTADLEKFYNYESTFDNQFYVEQFYQQTVATFYKYTLLKPHIYVAKNPNKKLKKFRRESQIFIHFSRR